MVVVVLAREVPALLVLVRVSSLPRLLDTKRIAMPSRGCAGALCGRFAGSLCNRCNISIGRSPDIDMAWPWITVWITVWTLLLIRAKIATECMNDSDKYLGS